MSDKKTALVVSAHAADFVWRCGGAIALHADLGYDVTVVCLSFGERGESAKLWKESGMTLEKVKAARRNEAEKAAKALGVHDLISFDLGDYPLRLTDEDKYRLVDVIRDVQPSFMLSHSQYDPYNTDHMYATQVALETRMIAQAWGHKPGQKVLGAPQLYLFEPHQTEQMGWKPDVFLDITPVWEKNARRSSAWKARNTSGSSTRGSPRTVPTTSSATPVASPAAAHRNMRKDSSRSFRERSTSFDRSWEDEHGALLRYRASSTRRDVHGQVR